MNATATSPRPRTFADAEEVLAAHLPGYAQRPHQQALAARIERAMGGREILLAEAGTGTGKSIAALVPAILSGRRVVIATATKALQSQYADKDLPFLAEYLGVPFKWAVIKGRSNYACAVKMAEIKHPTPRQAEIMAIVDAMKDTDEYTDREGLPSTNDRDWRDMSMSSNECPGTDCPFAGTICQAYRAKAKAAQAQIVITNMAYLAVDLKLREETGGAIDLLGAFDLLIVDEAHNLDNAITGALTDRMAQGTFARLAGDAGAWLIAAGYDDEEAVRAGHAAMSLWSVVDAEYATWQRKQREGRLDDKVMPIRQQARLETFGPDIKVLGIALKDLWQALRNADVDGDEPGYDQLTKRRYRLERRVANMVGRLRAFAIDEDDVTVRWVEADEGRTFLISVPVSPAPFLRKNVWNEVPAVLMSATLAPGKTGFGEADFSYTVDSLGLEEFNPGTFESGTPFDYPNQALIYVPERTLPVPSGKTTQAWRAYAQDVTSHMVRESGGGALLLFTSRSAMDESYRRLARDFEEADLEVLKQGDEPTPELVRKFKEDGNAVLFALRTFFEGIDIPGDALRLVILDKLPFPVPTDLLFAARCDAINRKAGRDVSFNKLSMPLMTLPLVQAAGRLLRTVTDRGVIAILDPRLTSKGYGAKILHSLPPARVTSDPREVLAFLRDMR